MESVSNNIFLTAIQLWQEYENEGHLPEFSIISHKRENDISENDYYFTAFKNEFGFVRAYTKACIPDQPKGIILYINDVTKVGINISMMRSLAKEGYIVFSCDTYGGKEGEGTLYRGGYVKFSGNRADLSSATPSSKDSPVFVWATIIRRLIDLGCFDYQKYSLAIVSEGAGCLIGWQLAANVSEVTALALFDGGQFDVEKQHLDADGDGNFDLDSNWERWQAAISPKAYAKNVNVPVFCAPCTNSINYCFDKIQNTMLNYKGECVYSISPMLENQVFFKCYAAMVKWLNTQLNKKAKTLLTEIPSLSFSVENTALKLSLPLIDSKIKSVTLCVAFNQTNPRYRNWHSMPMQKTEAGYEQVLPSYSGDKLLFAFVNVLFKDGYVLSSPLLSENLSDKELSDRARPPVFLLYDAIAKKGVFSHKTSGKILNEDNLFVREGELGIAGVGVSEGKLVNYKMGEITLQNEIEDRILQMSVLSENKATVTFSIFRQDEATGKEVEYMATREIEGLGNWQTLTFACTDFKTCNLLPMKKWTNLLKAEISVQGDVIISNLLWI